MAGSAAGAVGAGVPGAVGVAGAVVELHPVINTLATTAAANKDNLFLFILFPPISFISNLITSI